MQKLIKTLISNCPEDTIQFAKDLSKTIPYGSTISVSYTHLTLPTILLV